MTSTTAISKASPITMSLALVVAGFAIAVVVGTFNMKGELISKVHATALTMVRIEGRLDSLEGALERLTEQISELQKGR